MKVIQTLGTITAILTKIVILIVAFFYLDKIQWPRTWPVIISDKHAEQLFSLPTELKGFQQKKYSFVMHTHNDPGWILTMAEYQEKAVDDIIAGSVDYLSGNNYFPKFTFADLSFMQNWLKNNPEKKSVIKKLVTEGKLEIINGGVSMHDQACTYLDDLLNNYDYGREFSKHTLGVLPNIGWSIDAFGASRTSAYIFEEMGFRTEFLNRLPFTVKSELIYNRNSRFKWKTSSVKPSSFTTTVLADHYNTPYPLNFHQKFPSHFGDNIPNMDILSPDFDLMSKAIKAFSTVDSASRNYKENNILMLLGDDFAFHNFATDMDVLSVIIAAWKSNSITGRIKGNTFELSHLGEFLDKLESENISCPVREFNDGFPVTGVDKADGEFAWAGFYTTRPFLKRKAKLFGELYRSISNLLAAMQLKKGKLDKEIVSTYDSLEDVRFTVGLLTHHDAITGTCYNHVADDYLRMISEDTQTLNTRLQFALKEVFNTDAVHVLIDQYFEFDPSKGSRQFFSVISQRKSFAPVVVKVKYDIVYRSKVDANSTGVVSSYEICDPIDGCELNIEANVVAFAPHRFEVVFSERDTKKNSECDLIIKKGSWLHVGDVSLAMHRHDSNSFDRISKKSGTYVMVTRMSEPDLIDIIDFQTSKQGDYCICSVNLATPKISFLHVVVKDAKPANSNLTFRTKTSMDPLGFNEEADYVIRYKNSNIKSGDRFWTDSNGLEAFETVADRKKSLSMNYRPTAKFIQVKDSKLKMTVLVDRAEGSSSPHSGVAELDINRANFGRDNLGLDHIYRENHSIAINHEIILNSADDLSHRMIQNIHDSPLVYSLASQIDNYSHQNLKTTHLPDFIRISADIRKEGLMIRIYNMHERDQATIHNLHEMISGHYDVSTPFKLTRRSIDFNEGWPIGNNKSENAPQKLDMYPLSIATFKLEF